MLAVDITSSSVRSVDDSDDCQTLEWINKWLWRPLQQC